MRIVLTVLFVIVILLVGLERAWAPPPTTTTTSTTSTTLPLRCGDVNGDHAINIGDALLAAQFDVGNVGCGVGNFRHPELCDANHDNACNVGDALRMSQCDVGLISCMFTCGTFGCPTTTTTSTTTTSTTTTTTLTTSTTTTTVTFPMTTSTTLAPTTTITTSTTTTHTTSTTTTTTSSTTTTTGIPTSGPCQWNKQVKGTDGLSPSSFYAVAHDTHGNVIAGGNGGRSIDWGQGVNTGGLFDFLLIKYDASGNLVWAKRLPVTNDQVKSIATDANDNIFAVGSFQDTLDFGSGAQTSVGNADIFIVKYLPDGTLSWFKVRGSSQVDFAKSVAVDGGGNLWVTGYFHQTINFGGSPLTAPSGGGVFLAKFANDGTHLASQAFPGGVGGIQAQDTGTVAVDSSDNVVVSGDYQGSMTIGPNTFTSLGTSGTDVFLAKFTSDGAHMWSHSYGGTGTDQAPAVATGPGGVVVAGGQFSGMAQFGGATFTADGPSDMWLAKYAADGSHTWSQRFGGNQGFGAELINGLTVDTSGNILLTGSANAPTDFGCGPIFPMVTTVDFIMAKLASGGGCIWNKRTGGQTDFDVGQAVATEANGNVIAAGGFTDLGDFGCVPAMRSNTSSTTDAFVVQFGP